MKDFEFIQEMHNTIVSYEKSMSPLSPDLLFSNKLRESIASLLNSITAESYEKGISSASQDFLFSNKQKESIVSLLDAITTNKKNLSLSFSSLNEIQSACVPFLNNSLHNYVTATIQPFIMDRIVKRKNDIEWLIKNIFNAIYAPCKSISESEISVYNLVKNFKAELQVLEEPLSPQEMNAKLFHHICQKALMLDLTDKNSIFMPLVQLIKTQLPVIPPFLANQELIKERKALLEPYQPTRPKQAKNYQQVMAPLLPHFDRLKIKKFPPSTPVTSATSPTSSTNPSPNLKRRITL